MSYPFVQSHTDLGRRRGPILALTIHMAEGGGTVEYLRKPNPNNVSVHFVIERDGDIVQMLREDHMHSSIRTGSALRTGTDEDGFFGAKAAVATLGDWAHVTKTLGPNHATLAVEIEGFAVTGPNPAQKASLIALVKDLRGRYPKLGMLGHRDHNVKACPGRLIPWAEIGGHGPYMAQEADVPGTAFDFRPDTKMGTVTVKDGGHWYRELATGALKGPLDPERFGTHVAIGPVNLVPPIPGGDADDDRTTGVIVGTRGAALLWSDVNFTPAPAGITQGQLEAAVAEAVAQDRALARIVWQR